MRTSINISKGDTTTNMSEAMEAAAPPEVLGQLGQGVLAGIVADDLDNPIDFLFSSGKG